MIKSDGAKINAAKGIVSTPLFYEILADMEQLAVDECAYAQYDDHEKRQSAAAKIRAIRDFRAQVEALAKAGQSTPGKKAPA